MMNKELFQKRLSVLYNSWNVHKQELWGNSDIIVIHSQNEKSSNLESTQFNFWLFGQDFDDTSTIFGPSGIYFFSTSKNFIKIRSLCSCATLVHKFLVSVQLKPKNDEGFLLIDATIRNCRVMRNNNDGKISPFVVGYVANEYPKTKLFWTCINDLESTKYKAVIVNAGLSKLVNCTASSKLEEGESMSRVKESSSLAGSEPYEEVVSLMKNVELSSKSRVKENSSLASSKTYKDVVLMENLDLSSFSSSRGKEDKFRVPGRYGDEMFRFGGNWYGKEEISKKRNKEGDQLFKFGASGLDGKEDKSKEGNRSGDQQFKFGGNWYSKEEISKEKNKDGNQLFKFGASRLDGKEEKSKEGNKSGDQLFKFGGNWYCKEGISKEKNKNGDQLFKFGASRVDGKEAKAKEGNKRWDQLFRLVGEEDKSEEDKKDVDQLFKFGATNILDDKEDKAKEGNKDSDQLFNLEEGENQLDSIWYEEKQELKNNKLLSKRLTAFYSSWRKYKGEQWGKANVLVITTKSVGSLETLPHSMSSSFLVWLLDHEFPDTTAVFTDSAIEFLCTKESFSSLRTIGIRITMAAKVPVSVQLKKGEEHCRDWLKKTLCQVRTAQKSDANRCPFIVGCIKGESAETEALSYSKMFEVAYVDNALTNLLELGNFEKPGSLFAGQQPALHKCFQKLSLDTQGGEKFANSVSFSELAKIKSMDDKSYISHTTSKEEKSLLEKKGDASSPMPIDSSVNNEVAVQMGSVPSKPEENNVFETEMFKECNMPRKLEENKIFEDNFPSKLEESKILEDNLSRELAEKTLLEKKEGAQENQQHTPHVPSQAQPDSSAEFDSAGLNVRMEDSVQEVGWVTGVTDDATSGNSLPDDLNGSSSRKNSVISDGEDDEWTIVEREPKRQETEVAEKVSWKRWFMG